MVPANTRMLVGTVIVLILIIGFIAFRYFQKDATYEIYKARMEEVQKYRDILNARDIIFQRQKDSLIQVISTGIKQQQQAKAEAKTISLQSPIIKQQYNEKINRIDNFSSPELKQFFTDL